MAYRHKIYIKLTLFVFMITREKLYETYDKLMPQICEPYEEFLSVVACAVPEDIEDVCDLGIGTGNLSLAIKKKLPNVKIYGIDKDKEMILRTKFKIPSATCYNRDFFAETLPNVDYFVSSLATHHFPTKTRDGKLTQIVRSAKRGFINFDIMLFNGNNFEDNIQLALSFAKNNFNDEEIIKQIELEMRAKDNYASLEGQKNLFESLDMKFSILAKKEPYVVYEASWPTRNE